MGFKTIKWSFFEAGHGKGVPDAIGGSIKREADRKVRFGEDTLSASMFVEKMKTYKTNVSLVTEEEIEAMKCKLLGKEMKPIPGTMKIHQVIVKSQGLLYYRSLSCVCDKGCKMFSGTQLKCADIIVTEDNQSKPNIKRKRTSGFKRHKEDKKKRQMDKVNVTENEYRKYLRELELSVDYDQLTGKCREIENLIPELNVFEKDVSIHTHNLEIDFDAAVDVPDDFPQKDMYPCIVHADGNCLPSTGSVLAFGHPEHVYEIRMRIVLELVKNEDKYLEQSHLEKGIDEGTSKDIKNSYAQYSDMYVPGVRLTSDSVKEIYRQEVMSVTKNKSFMGIWEVHALASVLKRPLYSVYPKLGSVLVRKDLNRLVMPVAESIHNPVFLMWTSTRDDQTNEHWVPNHFVPIVQLEKAAQSVPRDINKNAGEHNGVFQTNPNNERIDTKPTGKEDPEDIVTIYLHEGEHEGEIELTVVGQNDESVNSNVKDENVKITFVEKHDTVKDTSIRKNESFENDRDKMDNTEEGDDLVDTVGDLKDECVENLLGSYVIIDFNHRHYLGYVEKVNQGNLFIECMRRVGKKSENRFTWPKRARDRSWFTEDSVIKIVDKPQKIDGNYYKLDDKQWKLFFI